MSENTIQQISKKSKRISSLSDEDVELFELCRMTGITVDPRVFHILLDLLRLDVSPVALYDILQDMAAQVSKSASVNVKRNSDGKSPVSHSSGKKKPPVAAKPKKIKSSVDNKISVKTV